MQAASSRAAAAPPRPQEHTDALVQELTEAVGASVRRVFKIRALHSQSTAADVRAHLPELARFLDSVRAPPRSTPARHFHTMRKVFRASSGAWLSRSARQSGVSALLGQQLVHLAADGGTAAVRFVARVLLDALLVPCSTRLGATCRACEWRQRRPKLHAMDCALVWHALLPPVASLALQWPAHVADELDARYAALRPERMRVNCVLAQVAGVWALVERLHAGITDRAAPSTARPSAPPPPTTNPSEVVELMQRLVAFLVRAKLLGDHVASEREAEETSRGAPAFDDLLMERFFVELQGFTFSSARSHEVVGSALQVALNDAAVRAASGGDAFNRVFVAKLSVLAGLACVSVKGQAGRIVSTLLRECRAREGAVEGLKAQRRLLLRLAVGFAAHFDLVGLDSVLDLLLYLLDCYRDSEDDRASRAESAVFLVYVAFHRREALEELTNGAGSTEWLSQVRSKLLECQDRVRGHVDPLEFRTLPMHWMSAFLKAWIGLSDRDVEAFRAFCCSTAATDDAPSEGATHEWAEWTDALPFRSWSAALAVSSAHARPHWIPPHDLDLSAELERPSAKRKATSSTSDGRASKKPAVVALDPEREERKLQVLLLPDIMERICSFMSAKRLQRLAMVSKAFAAISRRESLWRPLWLRLAAKEPEPPVCTHGEQFQHNWIAMYWARTKARRRVRRKLKQRVANPGRSALGDTSGGNDADGDGEPVLQICPHCDCHVVLMSTAQAAKHFAAHELYVCEKAGCGASFSSALKLKLHGQEAHPVRKRPKALPAPSSPRKSGEKKKTTEKQDKTRVPCGFAGCSKTYVSLKRLETHRTQLGHFAEA